MLGWRKWATDWRAMIGLAGVLLAVHVGWLYASRNGADLARCGALWAVLAGTLIARPVIRLGFGEWLSQSSVIGGGEFSPSPEEIEEGRQATIDAQCVQVAGPSLLVAGTILWGYGDLLGSAIVKHLL